MGDTVGPRTQDRRAHLLSHPLVEWGTWEDAQGLGTRSQARTPLASPTCRFPHFILFMKPVAHWPWEGPGSLCPLRPPGCDYSGQSVPHAGAGLAQAGAQSVHAGLSRAKWHGPQVPRGTLQCMEMPRWVTPGDTTPSHRLFLVPVSTLQLQPGVLSRGLQRTRPNPALPPSSLDLGEFRSLVPRLS